MNDDFEVPVLGDDPTPEERAEFVIMRLEQFIRDGRTLDEGMSFRKWQAMAKTEIAIAVAEAENSQKQDHLTSRRVLFVTAAAMVTIGFWGTAVSMHKTAELAAGIIISAAGLVLLAVAGNWTFRRVDNKRQSRLRRERLGKIEKLNKRIKRLEHELEKEEKALQKKLKTTKRGGREPTLLDMFMEG